MVLDQPQPALVYARFINNWDTVFLTRVRATHKQLLKKLKRQLRAERIPRCLIIDIDELVPFFAFAGAQGNE